MKNTKKVVTIVLAVVMCLSAITASAAWQFAGYDTTDLDAIGKIYNEVVNDKYTHRVKVDPLPEESIEWLAEGYELAFPHAGYDRLYLEKNAQQITRYNNMFPQWETRFQDFMWEITGEHTIYQRQQTNIPGLGWTWDFGNDAFAIPDSRVFVPTTRYADVVTTYKPYSVGPYDLNGKLLSEEQLDMIAVFEKDVRDTFGLDENGQVPETSDFYWEKLSDLDDKGQFEVTDEELSSMVNLMASKYLTGPTYFGENPTKDVADAYLKNTNTWDWGYEIATGDVINHVFADISWTAPQYEYDEPYQYYQYLIVNGLVFDGRNDTPVIWRYTKGVASPKVEWKYLWAEKDHPHRVIEQKVLDGNPVFELDGNGKLLLDENGNPVPVVRTNTGEYAKVYTKVTDTTIEMWLIDDRGGDVKIGEFERVAPAGGFFAGYVGDAGFVNN